MSHKFEVLRKNTVDLKFLEERIEKAMVHSAVHSVYKFLYEVAPKYDVSLNRTRFLHALQRQITRALDDHIARLDDEAAKYMEPLMLLRRCGVRFCVDISSDSERLNIDVVIRLGETDLTRESLSILWEKIRKIHDGITIPIDQLL